MSERDTGVSDAMLNRFGEPFARALATFVKALAEQDRFPQAATRPRPAPATDPSEPGRVSIGFAVRELSPGDAPALDRRAEQVHAANQRAVRAGTLRAVEFDPAKPAKQMGNRLKQLLKQRGVRQAELASALGVAPSVISRVLKHPERSRLATIRSIADAAGIPLNELV